MFRPLFRYTHELVERLLEVETARAVIDVLPLSRGSANELRDGARKALLLAAQTLGAAAPTSHALALTQFATRSSDCPGQDFLPSLHTALTAAPAGAYRTSSTLVYNQAHTDLIYVPPEASDVAALTSDLLDWLAGAWRHLPAVVVAGIAQQEVLLIQPFEADNATLARAAADVILWRHGYGLGGYASAETELARDPEAYEQATISAHSGVYSNPTDFTSWLEFYAAALATAASEARGLVQARFDAAQRPRIEGAPPAPLVLRDRQRQALDFARANGAIRSGEYQKLANIVPDTARRDFDELIDKNLVEVRGVGRGTHYVLTPQGLAEAQRRIGGG